jgi:hypothetical protein
MPRVDESPAIAAVRTLIEPVEESVLPFLECPDCRLTVRLSKRDASGRPCPRCGSRLEERPRSLFASDLPLRLRSKLKDSGQVDGPQRGRPA